MNILKKLLNLIFDMLSYPWFLGNIPYKLDKKEWYFKISDEDINPSFPHLHSKDGKYKMDIYTGDIYLNKKKCKSPIKSLSDKDFKKLWDDEKFKDDVLKKRETYIYNKEDLPEIPDVTDIKKIVRDSGFE